MDQSSKTSRRRRLVLLVLLPIALFTICSVSAVFGARVLFVSWLPPFEQRAWHDNPDDRIAMGKYICAHHMLDGKSRDEVVRLLGPAEATQYGDDTLWYSGDDGLDPYYIHVRFDEQGIVSDYELLQH